MNEFDPRDPGSRHVSRPAASPVKMRPQRNGASQNRSGENRERPVHRPLPPNAMKAPRKNEGQRPSMAAEKLLGRNVILAAILLVIVLVAVVIFAVQSCTKREREQYHGKNNVLLNTEPLETFDTSLPTYSEYTDDSTVLNITSDYGILIDLDKGEVIASKGGDQKIYPASMTKVMTLIVAYENISDLDKTFYTFETEMLDELYLAGASVAGFKSGETVSARDLLYGAILPSGGDATNALAELVGGSEEDFAELMNAKVEELRLKNTHFVTASGLHHPDHYSTCHDMAIILEYAISDPFMKKILSTYRYTTAPTAQHPEGIQLTSTMFSRMTGEEVEGLYIQGGKTGYTNEALNCLCSFAANCREDEADYTSPQYILVTAHASGEYTPVYDAFAVYKRFCQG